MEKMEGAAKIETAYEQFRNQTKLTPKINYEKFWKTKTKGNRK